MHLECSWQPHRAVLSKSFPLRRSGLLFGGAAALSPSRMATPQSLVEKRVRCRSVPELLGKSGTVVSWQGSWLQVAFQGVNGLTPVAFRDAEPVEESLAAAFPMVHDVIGRLNRELTPPSPEQGTSITIIVGQHARTTARSDWLASRAALRAPLACSSCASCVTKAAVEEGWHEGEAASRSSFSA